MKRLQVILASLGLASQMALGAEASVIQQGSLRVGHGYDAAGGTFKLDISADVMLGGNSCYALGKVASLVSTTEDRIVYVSPVVDIVDPTAMPLACFQIYAPVYQRVSLTVSGSTSDVQDVRVLNVGEPGNAVSVLATHS